MAEHEKGCGCGHSHGDEGIDDKLTGDVASKSLSDALRVSFLILKIIMAVLVILFVASGVFMVGPDEEALVLHFGGIRGDESGARVLKSGLHWAWPSPIDEIIKIPVTKQQVLNVDSAWYFLSEAEKLSGNESPPSADLNPAKDGYCLTRNDSMQGEGSDYSIVHSKWKLTYTIDDVELFFRNIYYNAPKPGEEFLDVMGDTVNPLLTALTDDAVVSTLVNFTIDEAIEHSEKISVDVALKLQAKLDRISSGIVVESLQPQKITWPRKVNDVFEASNMARQNSRTIVNTAEAYADQKMNQTGGVNAAHVLAKLTKDAVMPQDPREREKLFSLLAGDSQSKIAQARAYRTEVVESAKANAEYLAHLLEGYRANPKFILQNIYQQMITDVMGNADEKIFIDTAGEKRIMLNRDPTIRKQANKKDTKEE
jgi:membrane protease subunit HflK